MEPSFGIEEQSAMSEYLSSGPWITEFKKTAEFESEIAKYTGAKNCIVTNNGTISLTLAAIACGIGPGNEVIVPNYTMIATPNSVKMIGADPIFVDVEPDSLCLDIELVKKALNTKTKAIILVNANGRYPKVGIKAFEDLCKENGLFLIEDAAQALGSYYPDGRHMGTVGHIGSFSFSAPKIISTGQGGALITNDDQITDKIRKLKDFGRTGGGNDIHDVIGYNFKFTDVQAVIGLEQMKKLDNRIDRKREIALLYKDYLRNIKEVKLFNQDLENTVPWFYDGIFEKRNSLVDYLKSKNIETRVMYSSISHQKAYNLYGDYPVSEMVGRQGLWLPSSITLSNDQINYICSSIKSFYK